MEEDDDEDTYEEVQEEGTGEDGRSRSKGRTGRVGETGSPLLAALRVPGAICVRAGRARWDRRRREHDRTSEMAAAQHALRSTKSHSPWTAPIHLGRQDVPKDWAQ